MYFCGAFRLALILRGRGAPRRIRPHTSWRISRVILPDIPQRNASHSQVRVCGLVQIKSTKANTTLSNRRAMTADGMIQINVPRETFAARNGTYLDEI